MDERDPHEPLTPIAEAIAQMHELYLELKKGGFTSAEALQIIGMVLANNTQT